MQAWFCCAGMISVTYTISVFQSFKQKKTFISYHDKSLESIDEIIDNKYFSKFTANLIFSSQKRFTI